MEHAGTDSCKTANKINSMAMNENVTENVTDAEIISE